MNNLLDVLSFHHNLYPLMEFEDVYKLVFQHCYGAKHLDMGKEQIFSNLKSESINIKNEKCEIIDIGNDLCRVSLVNDDSFLIELSQSFYLTLKKNINCLDIECELSKNKLFICKTFNIDKQTYDEKMSVLREKGFPPISHSENYKKVYLPHYRVVHKNYLEKIKNY